MAEVEERVSTVFAAEKAAIAQVEGPLLRPWAGGESALEQVQDFESVAGAVLAKADTVFHPNHLQFLIACLAALGNQAMAYFGSDLAWQNALPDATPRAERKRLAALARLWDPRLLKQAKAQFDGDELIEPILLDIQTGTGVRDDAEDVLRLLALFFERWDVVGARLPWSREELEALEAEMTKLVKVLRPVGIAAQAATVLRQQAFTRLVRTYNEVLEAARYVARSQPEVLAQLKGLAPG
jgi:hypothetical protein